MESAPDACICNLFCKGRHIGPTAGNAGKNGAVHSDLGNVHASEYRLDYTGDRTGLDTVGAWVFRVHRRGEDRLPGCLTIGGRVAVDIAVANGRDRPPEAVMVFRVQHGDDRVVNRKRNERHETRAVEDTHLLCGHKLACERVISRCRTEGPEPRDLGLLGASLRAVLPTIILELVIVGCPLLALQRNRRAWPEL